ncbi:unnamed protein product [Diatraea saccharalis]|uniref:DUF7869 domain-containing protein n=1 Tax=Diatraea saccharalis TaxID=40085 RepID=A0A9N9R553_9NEOP|nr:unnamed protein product [Diatraea saccharalis]
MYERALQRITELEQELSIANSQITEYEEAQSLNTRSLFEELMATPGAPSTQFAIRSDSVVLHHHTQSTKKIKRYMDYYPKVVPKNKARKKAANPENWKQNRAKKQRVHTVIRKHFETGECPRENRGGDHKSHKFIEKRKGIRDFIQSLNCSEPHYCRGSSSARLYLPADLNINKIYKMYKERGIQPISTKALFRKVFNTEFNLGFGSPKTDICSTCLQLQEKIKVQTDIAKKNKLITLKRVHTLRAKAFYDVLKSKNEGIVTFSFDCQKNQPLPKLPDQSTYYSRQFYVYNLTIVQGSSKDKLTKENVFSYVWGEEEYSKDSNTVASAVYHRLNATDLTNIHTVRLISDGCAGQNKNTIIVGMCCKWLLLNPSVKKIEVYFPITGHSYLPSDRVFGHIEREIKRKDVIIRPQEYHDIIANHGTVILMGKSDCKVLNWKAAVDQVVKPPGQWHFKFMESKRIIIKRCRTDTNNALVQGEAFYKSNMGAIRNVCRRGKNIMMISPNEMLLGVPVKSEKINDVSTLLSKHYGSDWKEINDLSFYRNIIYQPNININNAESEESYCECRVENPALIV